MISIIITTFNRPTLLSRAIDSIFEALDSRIEIIVVDDDPSMSATDVVSLYPSVRYLAKRGVDRGLSKSRNLGISLARHEHLIFLDDDDYFTDSAVSVFLNAIQSGIDFYYFDFAYLRRGVLERRSLKELCQDHLLIVNQIPVGAYMIRKSAINQLFDCGMRSHEDWLFLLSNINWNRAYHVPEEVVVIDKSAVDDVDSMQQRRRSFFWMEFVGIYARFPAPNLSMNRQAMLRTLGIEVPIQLLEQRDSY
jgi:glycosyltransferase involved in cell wall biosynthesis